MTSMTIAPEQPITELTVAAARAGDHASIGALGAAAFRRTVAFYRYTGVPVDTAEDLAADAVESIIAMLPSLREVSRYDAWMWSIARNRLRDHWRRRRLSAVTEPLNVAPTSPEEYAILGEEHRQIRTAVQTLSLRDREILWLREVMELDYRTIADRMGSSPATVRVACHRARHRLQNAYEQIDTRTGRPS
jgi:RNA polymerase sigma factor (sigma-70 family)